MKKLENTLSAASKVFGIVPGIAVLISSIGVPPNASKLLFAGVIEALGITALMLLWVNRHKIQELSTDRLNRVVLVSVCVFLISFLCYFILFGFLVIEIPNSTALMFPFWSEGELKSGLEFAQTKEELIRQWGRDDVFKVINSSSKVPLLVTLVVFLLIYQLVFVSLTTTLGILAIKVGRDE